MLQFRAKVDLGAMAITGYSASPKAPSLLKSHHQIFYCHNRTLVVESYSIWRETVCIFHNHS